MPAATAISPSQDRGWPPPLLGPDDSGSKRDARETSLSYNTNGCPKSPISAMSFSYHSSNQEWSIRGILLGSGKASKTEAITGRPVLACRQDPKEEDEQGHGTQHVQPRRLESREAGPDAGRTRRSRQRPRGVAG